MAGYPPQQHYAAPPQPGPYHGSPYGMHPGGPHPPPPQQVHHGYPPPMPPPPPSGPYQPGYGPGAGPSGGPWADQQRFDHHPPPPGAVMHGGPPPPPPPGPPSMPRSGGYGNPNGPPPPNGGAPSASHPHVQGMPPQPQTQQMQQPPPFGAMPPSSRDFPPPGSRPGPSHPPPQPQPPPPQSMPMPSPPPHPSQKAPARNAPSAARSSQSGNSGGSGGRRGNAAAANARERGGGAAASAGGGGGKTAGGGGQRRQDKAGAKGAGSKSEAALAKAEAAVRAEAAAQDEPIQESKKIRKRKEVVDRIHRVHWDTLENRDLIYNDMQHTLATTGSLLLASPSLSRPYLLALNRLTLERDAQLRQIALLHAHQVESARTAYEQDRSKVEDEARSAKRAIRDRLLAAVEERRKRLREDKEGGEGVSDVLLDSSTRAHATRKLRNKAPGTSSRRDGNGLEPEGTLSLAARTKASSNGAGSLGISFGNGVGGAAGSDAEGGGASTPKEGQNGQASGAEGLMANPLLGSLLELTGFKGAAGHIAALPPSNFDALTSGAATATLLHLGVGGGMGDSSYMAGFRATLQSHGKGKKKTGTGKNAAGNAAGGGHSAGVLTNGAAGADGLGGGEDDEDEAANSRSMAAAAAAVAAATMLNGTGRLRWDQGKSVGQLTSAKDIEIESDLINIRKVGNKRRRR